VLEQRLYGTENELKAKEDHHRQIDQSSVNERSSLKDALLNMQGEMKQLQAIVASQVQQKQESASEMGAVVGALRKSLQNTDTKHTDALTQLFGQLQRELDAIQTTVSKQLTAAKQEQNQRWDNHDVGLQAYKQKTDEKLAIFESGLSLERENRLAKQMSTEKSLDDRIAHLHKLWNKNFLEQSDKIHNINMTLKSTSGETFNSLQDFRTEIDVSVQRLEEVLRAEVAGRLKAEKKSAEKNDRVINALSAGLETLQNGQDDILNRAAELVQAQVMDVRDTFRIENDALKHRVGQQEKLIEGFMTDADFRFKNMVDSLAAETRERESQEEDLKSKLGDVEKTIFQTGEELKASVTALAEKTVADLKACEGRLEEGLSKAVDKIDNELKDAVAGVNAALSSLQSKTNEQLDCVRKSVADVKHFSEENTHRLEEAIVLTEIKEEVTNCIEHLISCVEQEHVDECFKETAVAVFEEQQRMEVVRTVESLVTETCIEVERRRVADLVDDHRQLKEHLQEVDTSLQKKIDIEVQTREEDCRMNDSQIKMLQRNLEAYTEDTRTSLSTIDRQSEIKACVDKLVLDVCFKEHTNDILEVVDSNQRNNETIEGIMSKIEQKVDENQKSFHTLRERFDNEIKRQEDERNAESAQWKEGIQFAKQILGTSANEERPEEESPKSLTPATSLEPFSSQYEANIPFVDFR